jgi:hypothetical protein
METSQQIKAAGYSAKKEHWHFVKKHGVYTSCKKRLSYTSNDNREFYNLLKNYPETCCIKCANNFRDYVRIQVDLKEKIKQQSNIV